MTGQAPPLPPTMPTNWQLRPQELELSGVKETVNLGPIHGSREILAEYPGLKRSMVEVWANTIGLWASTIGCSFWKGLICDCINRIWDRCISANEKKWVVDKCTKKNYLFAYCPALMKSSTDDSSTIISSWWMISCPHLGKVCRHLSLKEPPDIGYSTQSTQRNP